MSAFSNSRSPDNSGRGGFLLCQRDPTTVFQGEFNRLAKSALDAQNAHIEKVKIPSAKAKAERRAARIATYKQEQATSVSSSSPSLSISSKSSKSKSKSKHRVTNYPKAIPSPTKHRPFSTRPVSKQPENRAKWLDWHSGLDATTVFPLSPVQIKPSLKMNDYVEHEDPEDAGEYISTRVCETQIRSSPPMSHPSPSSNANLMRVGLTSVIDQNVEERKKQEQFAFGKKVSNLGQGYGRTGWAYAHQNNQIKDGLTFVGDTAVSIKHNKTDTRTEHSHAKDIGRLDETDCVVCGKTCFADDRLDYENMSFHSKCFQCATCHTTLTSDDIVMYGNVLKCVACSSEAVPNSTPTSSSTTTTPKIQLSDNTKSELIEKVNEKGEL
tara:strand:- start:113 stop:1258 length:1146 start_codon:yes stop_codon:yes gene_type:complete